MNLFKKIAALSVGLAMAVGVGVAANSAKADKVSAEALAYTLSGTTTGGSAGYATESDITQSGISWKATGNTTMNPWRLGGNSLTATVRPIYSTTAISQDITKIMVESGTATATVNSLEISVHSNSDDAKNGNNAIATIKETSSSNIISKTVTLSKTNSTSWAGKYYRIAYDLTVSGSSNKYIQFKSAKFYYEGEEKFTVTYNSNGGAGTVEDSTQYSSGTQATVLTNAFTRDYRTFTGWNTSADGSGTGYSAGNKITMTSNVTLYAQWSAQSGQYTDDTTNGTITWDLSKESYSAASANQVSWESPRVTMVADKGSASTAANNYLPPAQTSSRFYANSKLTFTPVADDSIIKIEFLASTEGYATALANSSWTNASAEVDSSNNKLVIITPTDGSEACYASLGGTSGASSIVVYYGTLVPVTKYAVVNKVDFATLNKDEIAEGATLSVTITPDSGYELPESLEAVTMAGSPVAYTFVNGVVTVTNVQGNIVIEGACVRVNPIKALYSQSSGASVDVYAYYVGFLDGTGPVIMDGDYGIVIYNKTADVSGYTAGETILHVTGSISIYKGLYEVGSSSISVASGTYEVPSEPVVYAVEGGETADFASRTTTVSGVPTLVDGSFDVDAGTSDIKMSFEIGAANPITVFYKSAAQTADSEAFAAIKAAVNDTKSITVKGFTGWYNGFQVQMNGYVKEQVGYTAEDFAEDLLSQTYTVCSDSEITDKKSELIKVWNDLQGNDKYPSLPADQKTILGEAIADEHSENVVEKAMARYDYLVGRYGLSNFINGRTPAQSMYMPNGLVQFNPGIIIGVASAIVVVLGVGFFFAYRKKKQD